MKINAVFFDCDGVLVNTEPLHYRAFLKVLSIYGVYFDYKTYVDQYIGFDDRDAFRAIAHNYNLSFSEADIPALVQKKNDYLLEEASKGVESFDGVVSFVRSVYEAGVPAGVVSGSLRKEVETFLKCLGILDFFCIFVTADDVKRSKPDPESYQKALTQTVQYLGKEISPSRCVVFEDTPAGVESAKGAGMFVVAVEHSFKAQELVKADLVIPSFKDLNFSEFCNLIKRLPK
ncbi:MAG: HAD family phosphatase [Thermodesulforhabdaceae bacterium]